MARPAPDTSSVRDQPPGPLCAHGSADAAPHDDRAVQGRPCPPSRTTPVASGSMICTSPDATVRGARTHRASSRTCCSPTSSIDASGLPAAEPPRSPHTRLHRGDHAGLVLDGLLHPLDRAVRGPGFVATLGRPTDDEAEGGSYWGPRWLFEIWEPRKRVRSSRTSRDEATAARLWSVSEGCDGVRYFQT